MKKIKFLVPFIICFFVFASLAYAVKVDKSKTVNANKTIKQEMKSKKIFKHKQKKIKAHGEKYAQNLKKWKAKPNKKMETVFESVYLSRDEANLEIVVIDENSKKNKEYKDLLFKLNDSFNLKNTDSTTYNKKFIIASKKLKEKINDSRIDAYIAYLAEKNGKIEYAYESILEALSKQPDNKLYKKLFKRIYEKRADIISAHRQEIKNSKK